MIVVYPYAFPGRSLVRDLAWSRGAEYGVACVGCPAMPTLPYEVLIPKGASG